ncbi:WD repeat and SOCS box-containing protein 1-like isoform X2 [Panulirus ornatus]|uniref:WD repeat and SOCS box-containing protein 1-like isoform X2 n=1 Tax=Panulirus ornatus TaxID=150431 RepID=UPI003A85E1B5
MEHTLAHNKEHYGQARVIGELITGRNGNDYAPGGESWKCAFAPDESRFAWSCGFRKVIILPWNRYKNCLWGQNGAHIIPLVWLELQSYDNQDAEGYELFTEKISIDAGFPVTSIAFGTGTPEQDLVPVKKEYWTRFDFSKDLILATGHSNGRIRIWDPYTGKLLLELTDHMKPVTDLAFAPDGSLRLVSASKDCTIKVWDMCDDGNMFKTLREHPGPVRSLCWSPNGKYLCSTGEKQKVLLWDMDSYTLSKRFCGHYNNVLSCAFSPDGAMLATASCDTRVIIWDTNSGEQLRVLNHMNPPPGVIYMSGENNSAVRGVTFSSNGCSVATICSDGFLRFWNLMNEVDEPESMGSALEGDAMLNCSFSPLGGAVSVGHASGSVVFFLAPPMVPSLLHLSRMSVRRAMGDIATWEDVLLPHTLKPYLQYKQW